ncbi:MAG: hypothetical protein E2O75_05010 [Chloroflexi bacterium]|nr:MAG: hypothetical protein E2O75_05010 [Chloroflexota bacterium]
MAEAQKLVSDAAMETGESMEVIRTSAQNLTSAAKAGMDLEDALVRSTKMAQRFNVEGDTMSEIWGRVIGGGFAGSIDEAEALIEQVGVTMLNTGVSMEDAFNPNDMMEFFAKMKQFGVPIQSAIVLLENMEGTVRDLGEALELPEELGEMLGSTKGIEGITAASRLTSKELSKNFSIAQNLVTVLKAGPKAFKVLQMGLGEKATIGFERMLGVDIIEAASRRKLKTAELEDALARVESTFTRAAKVQFDATEAADRNAEFADTAAKDFQNALTKMEDAFQTEQVTTAIKKVAKELPDMAEGIGDFVSYAVDNPWTTITGVVGAKLALAVGGTIVQEMVAKAAAAMFSKAMAASILASAGGMAATTATGMGLGGVLTGGAMTGGALTAKAALAAGATAAAAAVLAAAGTGVAIGTGIGHVSGQEESMANEYRALQAARFVTGTTARIDKDSGEENIAAAIQSLATMQANLYESGQTGVLQRTFAGITSIATGEKSTQDLREEAAAKIAAESERLIEALSKIRGAAEGAAQGLDNVKQKAGGSTRGTDHLPQTTGNAAVPG